MRLHCDSPLTRKRSRDEHCTHCKALNKYPVYFTDLAGKTFFSWSTSIHVHTCGLTACTPGSASGPTLGNEYGKPLPFLLAHTYSRGFALICAYINLVLTSTMTVHYRLVFAVISWTRCMFFWHVVIVLPPTTCDPPCPVGYNCSSVSGQYVCTGQ